MRGFQPLFEGEAGISGIGGMTGMGGGQPLLHVTSHRYLFFLPPLSGLVPHVSGGSRDIRDRRDIRDERWSAAL